MNQICIDALRNTNDVLFVANAVRGHEYVVDESACMIKAIALDMATKLGHASNTTKPRISGVEVFDVKRGCSPGSRYLRFSKWLMDKIQTEKPDMIAYEQPHQRGGAATEIALGFATHVQSICALKNIEHVAVSTSEIKIFATGKGNADKQDMMTACAAKLGIIPEDDNHSDALWLLAYVEANYAKVSTQ